MSVYCLQRVLAAQPDYTENVQWQRAHLLSELGEHRRVAKAMRPLMRKYSGNDQYERKLVRSYYRLGIIAKAIQLLDGLITARLSMVAGATLASGAVN